MELQSPLEGTLIVIPAYNEAENLKPVLAEIKDALPGVAVLVVDDGSIDGTSDVAQSFGIPVLIMPFNVGVGGAMRAGFTYALRNGFSNVVQLDADGQHVPSEVPRMIAELESADVVVGSRFAPESTSFRVSPIRRFVMKILAISLTKIAGTKLTDVTSGFRATGPKALNLFSTSYPPEYLGDTIESLVLAHRAKLTIKEIPTTIRARNFGASSQSRFKATIYTLRALVVLCLAVIHKRTTYQVGKDQ
jgi:glycosyltransferase involved in cell wall biosynthesis